MVEVLGVHGIWQGAETQESLTAQWSRALQVGLRAVHPGMKPPTVVVPHLSPLLLGPSGRLGPGDDLDDLTTLTDGEIRFIESGLADLVAGLDEDEVDQLAASGATLGLQAFPTRRGLRLLAAADGRWRGGGRLALRMLREVGAYLTFPAAREQVARRLRVNVGVGTRVVIAHSLGSVMAYDVLAGGGLVGVSVLVTCGSPLGWPTVRVGLAAVKGLAGPAQLPALPDMVWTNVHDARDAVTGGLGLNPVWGQVRDRQVNNPLDDSHGARGYLRQWDLVAAVVEGQVL